MTADRTPDRATRRLLSLACMIAGVLLLLVMPLTLFFFAVTGATQNHLPGTLVIVASTGGMALLILGAVLRD